ncbi:MAG TPA: hypothetical protein PLL14_08405 [Accumulibacter sp.]|nr:hypothetical protein [Accumulibacter sp.]
MQAIELETTISPQGGIVLPADYKALYGRHARVILLLADDPETAGPAHRRSPPPQFAGKVRELGEVMSSVSPAEWGIEERSYPTNPKE